MIGCRRGSGTGAGCIFRWWRGSSRWPSRASRCWRSTSRCSGAGLAHLRAGRDGRQGGGRKPRAGAAALTAIGPRLPPRRITVNLAPADLLKEGSHFDLPIALGLLAAMGVLPAEDLEGYSALGELGLDGPIAPVAGVLPAAIAAAATGRGLICPAAQAARRPGPAGSRCWRRRRCWRWSTTSRAPSC